MHDSSRFRWGRRIALTVLSLFVGFPLYVMLSASLQPLADVGRSFRWLPRHITLSPYRDAWTAIPLGHYLANSAIIAGCSAVLAVLVSIPAAFALARYRFRGRRAFGTGILSTQLLPGMFFLLPTFLLYAQFGRTTGVQLIGTYPALVLVDLGFAVPFGVWLLTGWFASQPSEAEEAAALDGAGSLTVLLRVAVPQAVPAITAVLVFAFGLSWSEVLFAAVLTDQNTTTVAIGLPALTDAPIPLWNALMAASIISALPVVAAWVVATPILNRVLRGTP